MCDYSLSPRNSKRTNSKMLHEATSFHLKSMQHFCACCMLQSIIVCGNFEALSCMKLLTQKMWSNIIVILAQGVSFASRVGAMCVGDPLLEPPYKFTKSSS